MRFLVLIGLLTSVAWHGAVAKDQSPQARQAPEGNERFIAYKKGKQLFINATIIDGTGAPPRSNTDVFVNDGVIENVTERTGPRNQMLMKDVTVIDMAGKTLLPGLVMMHEHLFYPMRGDNYASMPYSFPALYLAGGETTARTTGSMSPYTDLGVRAAIESGQAIGPKLDITGPYLTGPGIPIYDMIELKGPQQARETVNFWADQGVTSFKVYMHITRENLKAAIGVAHARGIKVTGHLCSVTYREAAELGIDNLEHGFGAMTDFVKGKKPDECPKGGGSALADVDLASAKFKSLVKFLIDHHVVLTSTLGVFESFAPGRPEASEAARNLLIPELREDYEKTWAQVQKGGPRYDREGVVFAKLMKAQKMFVDTGGTLMMGSDPTGYGGVLPGYSSKRELELLVESGFSFPQAVQIATLNAARYLGRDKEIGTIEAGKHADLVVIDGDPMKDVKAVENMPLVFKDGVGYDTAAIINSFKGEVGLQ
ncbi:MAG: amidohydrolase family protein [Alphaproteobacteria bacterium]